MARQLMQKARQLAALSVLSWIGAAGAQAVPGEDPVVLGRVSYLALPTGAAPRSGAMDPAGDLPAWMRAKVSRYEAQSFSNATDTILTDRDVVNTTRSVGTRRTCVQEVGSSTTMARPGSGSSMVRPANNTNQVVVLRGDLVNVCR